MADDIPTSLTILVLGSLNMDLVTIAPRIPLPGETILTSPDSFFTGPGGKGANQAFALSKLCGKQYIVQMVGMVGDDEMGKELVDALRQGGVNVDRIGVCREFMDQMSKVKTGVAMIILEEGTGQNHILVTPGANFHLIAPHIPLPNLSDFPPPLSIPSLIVLQQEIRLSTVAAAIALYHEHSIPIILNPAPAFPLSTLRKEDLDYSKVSYLLPNETEASTLLSDPALNIPPVKITTVEQATAAATQILSTCGVQKAVVITLGGMGAVVSFRTGEGVKEEYFPARKVPVVDTTGAGDTFTAAFAVEIARGSHVTRAVRVGINASSLAVQRKGTMESIPDLAEVEALMSE